MEGGPSKQLPKHLHVVKSGILGVGLVNVELEATCNVWGNVVNVVEGQGHAEPVQNEAQGGKTFDAHCGLRAHGRGGGPWESQTRHLITIVMRSMESD